MLRRLSLAAILIVFSAVSALAGAVEPYSADTFAKAVASGKAVIVHVHADWCPTCRKQQPVIKQLSESAEFKKVEFVQVNYDKDTDFLKAHKVSRQSVILVFKGGKEVARLNGTTDADEIAAKLKAGAGVS
jgi:thiol-disulfide isomerase/thioredoxin